MAIVASEVESMAKALNVENGKRLVSAACLLLLSKHLFVKDNKMPKREVDSLMGLQRACVASWLMSEGIEPTLVDSALAGLERACVTAKYLARLPA